MPTKRIAAEPQPWSSRRLRLAMAGAALVAVATITGGAILVAQAVRSEDSVGGGVAPGGGIVAPPPVSVRDRIAAAPMVSLDPSAATQPDVASAPAPAIRMPNAVEGRGPAGIDVYGHSAEGAVAQLAAIDVAVLEAMDVTYTTDVHRAWVLPGGPSVEQWDLAVNVAAFLRGARQGSAKDAGTTVTAIPAGGMVKGVDGPDWVLACVLLDVRATIQTSYRMGWGHCARMQWVNDRWQIGPGTPPAQAPSAWPGSAAAATAGWHTWVSDEQEPRR